MTSLSDVSTRTDAAKPERHDLPMGYTLQTASSDPATMLLWPPQPGATIARFFDPVTARAFAAEMVLAAKGQSVPADLRRAYERLQRVVDGNVGFPECVEASQAFTLAAYAGIGAMLAQAESEPLPVSS